MSAVHVFYDGQSYDYSFDDLFGNDLTASRVTSEQVKTAVAQRLDVGLGMLENLDVEFEKNGNINVHAPAVFG